MLSSTPVTAVNRSHRLAQHEPLHVAAGVIRRQGQVLVSQRRPGDEFAGLWEFPGGKLEPGETPAQALRRELAEELGIVVGQVNPLLCLPHHYPQRSVVLHTFEVLDYQGLAQGLEGQSIRWLELAELSRLPFMPANGAILKAVLLPKVYRFSCAGILGVKASLLYLEQAIAGGLRLLQVHEPAMNHHHLREYFAYCREICEHSGVKLLLHGRPGQALRWQADGVHLTSSQLFSLPQRPLPARMWVAASCHNHRELVRAASLKVDFVVLSSLKKTSSHPLARPLGWRRFAKLCARAVMPVYAQGDMQLCDIATACARGAQGVAIG